MEALSAVYGAAASWRRHWYARQPARARRLDRPVISIGNMRVGGTGKTPTTAAIARLLLEQGERPSILSRGYGRQKPDGGVTVVSDPTRILADVAHAGDEPLLLARQLPGVPVLVCAERYLAGRQAERQFDVTVHLLDDGFQHVRLRRDVDILLVDEADLTDHVLPAGRLREPLANASSADAAIVPGADHEHARGVARRLGIRDAFGLTRLLGRPWIVGNPAAGLQAGQHVFALAGIARPERFFDDLRAAGTHVAGQTAFGDHHVYRQREIDDVVSAARGSGASAIVTTEKDAVRLSALDLSAMPFAAVPLIARVEPADAFGVWLATRLRAARTGAAPSSR